jgi:hypothetical protein
MVFYEELVIEYKVSNYAHRRMHGMIMNKLLPVLCVAAIYISANFCTILNGPYGISKGSGETDTSKKPEVANLVSDSL